MYSKMHFNWSTDTDLQIHEAASQQVSNIKSHRNAIRCI
jgi:hypothetical protein